MFYGKRISELEARVVRLELTVNSLARDMKGQEKAIDDLYDLIESRKGAAPESEAKPKPKPRRAHRKNHGKEAKSAE